MSKTNHSDLECKVSSAKSSVSGSPRRSRSGSARKSGDPETVELCRQISKLKQKNSRLGEGKSKLKKANAALSRENTKLKQQLSELKRKYAELRRLHFGGKTDRAEVGADDSPAADDSAPSVVDIPQFEFGVEGPAADGGASGGRLRHFPDHFDTEERTIEPPKCCPNCESEDWQLVGVDEMETLDVKPVAYYRLVTRRPKVRCANCGKFRQAPAPKGLFPRSYLGGNLVADMAMDHVFMAMPINRQGRRMVHAGLPDITRTLSNCYHRLAVELKPMLTRMKRDLLRQGIVFADDTVFKINLEEPKGKLTRGRFWVYVADGRGYGCTGPAIVCIEATKDWKMEHPKKFLKNFTGKLHTDSYPGWLSIHRQSNGRFPLQLCWAHARRYFVNATLKFSGASQRELEVVLDVLKLIRELSIIEADIHGMSPEQKLAERGKRSAPLVESVRSLLAAARPETEKHSALARAIDYMLDNWELFITFLSHGEVGMHNNIVEQQIRPVADIRNSSGHSLTLEGAESNAILLSFALTCKANDINPYEWMRDLVKRLPHTPKSERWKLIPYNWVKHFGGGDGGRTGTDDDTGTGSTDQSDATQSSSGNATDGTVSKSQPAGNSPPASEEVAREAHELQAPDDGKSEVETPRDHSVPDHLGDEAAVAGSIEAEEVDRGMANAQDRTLSQDAAACADGGDSQDKATGTDLNASQNESGLESDTAVAGRRPDDRNSPSDRTGPAGSGDPETEGSQPPPEDGEENPAADSPEEIQSATGAAGMQAFTVKLWSRTRQWLLSTPMKPWCGMRLPMWFDPLLNMLWSIVLQAADRCDWQHAVASAAIGAGADCGHGSKAKSHRTNRGKRDPPSGPVLKCQKTIPASATI